MNNEDNDNIYFMFKDTSNSGTFSSKEGIFSSEPKINNSNIDWDAFQEFLNFNPSPSLEEKLKKNLPKPKIGFDTRRLERQLISLLDSLEELLEYLEDRRHNNDGSDYF